MNGMVIDPATKSLGWCWIKDGEIYTHGTITAKGLLFKRLWDIFCQLRQFADIKFDYVVTEKMNRMTHYSVNMAIGVIFVAFGDNSKFSSDLITPSEWKAFYGLKIRDKGPKVRKVFKRLFPKEEVKSDDEIEAILMANYLLKSKKKIF